MFNEHSAGALKSDPPSGGTPYFGFNVARAIIYRDRRPQVMSAVVSGLGNLNIGSDGVTGSSRSSTGTYLVTFDRSVRNCAMVAGIGLSSHADTGPLSALSRNIRTGVNTGYEGINVSITNPATGSNADADFHLIVTCSQP